MCVSQVGCSARGITLRIDGIRCREFRVFGKTRCEFVFRVHVFERARARHSVAPLAIEGASTRVRWRAARGSFSRARGCSTVMSSVSVSASGALPISVRARSSSFADVLHGRGALNNRDGYVCAHLHQRPCRKLGFSFHVRLASRPRNVRLSWVKPRWRRVMPQERRACSANARPSPTVRHNASVC